ncbi:MAG: hypothetical protein JWQ43_3269 [Glaciihabitans sp.]|nr:hypothetical protein [Glaciihabitans sp.]
MVNRTTWESGSITLPRAEFSRLRDRIITIESARIAGVHRDANRFWNELPPQAHTDPAAFSTASQDFSYRYGDDHHANPPRELSYLIGLMDPVTGTPVPPSVANLPIPGDRDRYLSTFVCKATLKFDKTTSTARWAVPAGDEAATAARTEPLGLSFFRFVDGVTWTEGTGGVFSGNDSETAAAGGADYCIDAWGPLGAAAEPSHTRSFRMEDGAVVDPADPATRKVSARAQ